MDLGQFIEEIRQDPDYRGQIRWLAELPSREARHADLQVTLHETVARILEDLGIERLYVHQARAVEAVLGGEHVVTVTGTASGKTLTYVIPLAQRLYERPSRRALLMYPTKALAQDQLRKLADFGAGTAFRAATYDGDTPGRERRRIKREAQVVLTNPDMLHIGILPYHHTWGDFFRNLEFVVLDEVHTYRGVFGSHTANVLRRLRRICAGYGSTPQFIACSATIGNPGELFEKLTGLQATVIDDDGAPQGRRFLVLWEPPEIEGQPMRRRSANLESAELMADLVKAHIRTIVFVLARSVAELILRYAREGLEEFEDLAERIMSYRGGYLPEERREIERKLFAGELLGVVSTTALEVGVDIGGLDAAILNGYPGTISSTWQQIGRSGRGQQDSLAALVALPGGVHRYLLDHPEYLLSAESERALIDPGNRYILAGHLLCAAFERPIETADAALFGDQMEPILEILADPDNREGSDLPFVTKRTKWYWVDPDLYPAAEISLRSTGGPPWSIRLQSRGGGELLGTVDAGSAFRIVHPGAVYLHAGESYVVQELDLDDRTAWVKRKKVDYYTQPMTASRMAVLGWQQERELPSGARALLGELEITSAVTGYRKVRQVTEQGLGTEELELPTTTIETVGVALAPGEADVRALIEAGRDLMGSLHALEHAMIALLPIFAFCDARDVGGVSESEHDDLQGPVVSVYDGYNGGVGIAEAAYDRLDDLLKAVAEQIAGCDCEDGCPACVQAPNCGDFNEPLDKEGALLLARRLVGE